MGKLLLKTDNLLKSLYLHGKFFIFGQQNMVGCKGTHLDVRRHMYLYALLKKPFNESFSSHLPKFQCRL